MSTSNKLARFNNSTGMEEVDFILADVNTVRVKKILWPKNL